MTRDSRASKNLPLPPVGGVRKTRNADWLVVDTLPLPQNSGTTPTPNPPPLSSPPPTKSPRKKFSLRIGWSFWALLALFGTVGTGTGAVMLLLKLPTLPNCPSLFMPTASISMRLYCAELAANKQSVDNLLEAIALVQDLPADHPMKAQVNEYIAQWSKDILALADEDFQRGQLDAAIATARRVPDNTPAHALVEKQIKKWQEIWQIASGIYQEAEQALRDANWIASTRFSAQLMEVENRYWAETKYKELLEKGKEAREDTKQLNRAYQLISMGSISNLIEAIELAKAVNPNSYAYNPAQKIIQDASQKLINLARISLDKEDWQGIIQIANRLSRVVDTPEARRLDELAQAVAKSQEGTAAGLQAALARLQRIDPGNPLYDRVQRLSARWRQEADGMENLERARQLASSGRSIDLVAAIAQARLVNQSSPRYNEATAQIRRWTEQMEGGEDRPILDRAEQLARGSTPQSYQAAIQQASLIAPNRALYRDAQARISQWSTKLESDQDQPYLDQAQALARAGNYQDAINFASQISSGRTLYNQARANIQTWQTTLNSQNQLGLPETSTPSPETPQNDSASQQVLTTAQSQARTNLAIAIATAQSIPVTSPIYPTAQAQIQEWQRQLGNVPKN